MADDAEDPRFVADVTTRLGARSHVRAWEDPSGWQQQLHVLAAGLGRRLVSSGGRPTDPNWTMTRRVPFSEDTWSTLQQLAEELHPDGRTVAPAQLAATFVEQRIAQLDAAIQESKKRDTD